MFNTRLCLFDGVHHKVVKRTCRCCDSNIVLLWDGSEVPEATLHNASGPCISRASGTYVESANTTGALQQCKTIQHSVLSSTGGLRSPGFFYFLPADGCLLSALLELLVGMLEMTSVAIAME